MDEEHRTNFHLPTDANCKLCCGSGWQAKRHPPVIGALFSQNYEPCSVCRPTSAAAPE